MYVTRKSASIENTSHCESGNKWRPSSDCTNVSFRVIINAGIPASGVYRLHIMVHDHDRSQTRCTKYRAVDEILTADYAG